MAGNRRAATTSKKALHIASLAAAEALEDSQVVPAKKPRGHPKKKKEDPQPTPPPAVPKEELPALLEAAGVDDIEWTDELTWTLVSAIEDDDIREGLFPGAGGPVKSTLLKTKKKTYWHYELAVICFGAENGLYKVAFDAAVTPPQKALWNTKIKNRIASLVTKARANITAMGETGAGLGSADEINEGTALATKWDEIRLDSPWFFEIRKLIASRPNLQPVGLGNNETAVDISILLPTTDDDTSSTFDTQSDIYHEISDTDEDPPHPPAPTSDDDDDPPQPPAPASDNDDDEFPPVPTLESAPVKRKRVESEATAKGPDTKAAPARKKTKPHASTSAPAPGKPVPAASATPTPAASKKATKGKEGFTATVLAEEETTQRMLKLKEEKYKGQKEVQLARINAEAELRLAREKRKGESKKVDKEAKIALQRLKMEQEHQYRLAQLHAQTGPSFASSSSNDGAFGLLDESTMGLNDGLGHLSYTGRF
ncbi:hypothetical protein C8F04DRAFT_1252813 [Mycena alexandri]|uniref:Uncharacterized protein n=1 Tax=Mycena alexandri TaxID=1745969 RepID=A0AAD6T7X7_9AGAR|nr:hypothetical protein C8F04DRAFT_1252813 [Mycena alexandri]